MSAIGYIHEIEGLIARQRKLEARITELEAANERLRAFIADAVDTLEAMDLHVDNPLYDRLRVVVDEQRIGVSDALDAPG